MSGTDVHPDNPVLLACRELGRAMDLFDEAACARLDLGRSDLRALNLLEHGPVGASALADQLGLTRSAVTALIDRLVHAGFVARAAVPGDRRATAIELMPATWQAFAEVYRPLGERVSAAVARLSEPEQHALLTALRSMRATFDEARHQLERATDPDGTPTGGSPAARATAAGRTARRSRS
jgi:DNA-binding MarR family transcriptional regulator